jgi:hydroxymethylglutaryl-CoA lyase
MAGYPKILHTEEAMRDGLQIENAEISAAAKIRLLDALSETGLQEIAVGSFASPKWTPQMANIDEVIKGFTPKPGVRYTYSYYNERGRERALAFTPPLSERIREYQLAYSMCDIFQQRNVNRTQADDIARWPKQIKKAIEKGLTEGGIHLTAAFGSNWTGEFSLDQRMLALDRMHQCWTDAGIKVTRVGLSDAMSWAMPHEVERQILAVKARWPDIIDFNLHLHNGRGVALASIYEALRVLDSTDTLRVQSSVGGMAGCPYCGNGRAAMMIATEDLMHLLQEMGIYTGVDLTKLIIAVEIAEEIVGHSLYGFVSKAGPRPHYEALYPMDMPRVETLDEAKHFMRGPSAYAGAASPWREPIKSYQRSIAITSSELAASNVVLSKVAS